MAEVNRKIAVIGLGYVGLPLAVEFGKSFEVVGFDVKASRIAELERGVDRTKEVSADELRQAKGLSFTADASHLKKCDFFIVAVPTPIDEYKRPDLGLLLKACETVGRVLKKNDVVVFESTVYPGATEEDCVPVLERVSGLKFNRDFYCGYSPERINPGDKEHTFKKITKVVSGSTAETLKVVQEVYGSVVEAGTFPVTSIKVAEAAKVIENCQRDINIAFVNELALIFNRLNIDTHEVLKAAGTKWNFLPFKPGLVGGHCIGVDPYYLTHKAQSLGYHPEIILAGRRLNDNMGLFVASEIVKLLISKKHRVSESRVLVLGATFKENCPDTRNSRVFDIVKELKSYSCAVEIYDPVADQDEIREEYGETVLVDRNRLKSQYDAVVLAVAHETFKSFPVREYLKPDSVVYDVKGFLPSDLVTQRL